MKKGATRFLGSASRSHAGEMLLAMVEGFMKAVRDVAQVIPIAAAHQESTGAGGEVYFSLSGLHGHAAEGETLLEAALNAWGWIGFACQ